MSPKYFQLLQSCTKNHIRRDLQWVNKHITDIMCYIFRDIEVKKVSNSRSDLRGHSRSLMLVPFDEPHAISYSSPVQTTSYHFSVRKKRLWIFNIMESFV